MSLSNYAENAVANAICNNTSFAVAQVYVKLHTGDPGEDGTPNAAGETDRTAASFGAASGGVCTSDAAVSWSSVSTTETYTYVSFWDASSGGNCLGSGALTSSVAVTAGDDFTIASAALTLTLT